MDQHRLGNLFHRWFQVSVASFTFQRMSSDSSSHASRSDAVSLTLKPLTGLTPVLGSTVDTESFPSTLDSPRAYMTRHAPDTPMVPKLRRVVGPS